MDDVQRTIETVLKKERTIKTVLKEARAKRDAELATLRADRDDIRASAARWEERALKAEADLAEARADVARFEAALDAANRELAQARATIAEHAKWCMDVLGAQSCNRHTAVTLQEYVQAEIAVGCAQCAIEENTRLRAELAQARADVRALRDDRELWRDAAYQAADVTEELAQARALADGWHRSATYYKGGFMAIGSAWYDETKRKAEQAGE